ncbi:stage II sporulation protein M [Desulforamulus hydrothermalis]|uniref:Stage II sporulation protein M n=1 Tax=Desulforamulus hydrothermalis Lam5 = DSM 18033 TaxID=1121428 RepID=K8EK75_9FIRM|nr:stage II sporulation protein M [Desulforamulus hydrothermalis]CCO08951.1 Stage II sporulation protein M [Desulforamulus hydrothermalis Lam5 = DSM 18033]
MAKGIKNMWKASWRDSWPVYLLGLATLLAGLCFGCWGAYHLDGSQAGRLSVLIDSFVNQAGSMTVDRQQAVKNAIANNLFLVGLFYLLGLTVIGMPAVLVLLSARGFSLGFTIGFLTRDKVGEGMVIALASVMPQNVLFIPAIYLAGVAALSFSWLLIKRLLDSKQPVLPGLLGYHVLMLVVCCIAAAAGLVEAFVTPDLTRAAINLLIK